LQCDPPEIGFPSGGRARDRQLLCVTGIPGRSADRGAIRRSIEQQPISQAVRRHGADRVAGLVALQMDEGAALQRNEWILGVIPWSKERIADLPGLRVQWTERELAALSARYDDDVRAERTRMGKTHDRADPGGGGSGTPRGRRGRGGSRRGGGRLSTRRRCGCRQRCRRGCPQRRRAGDSAPFARARSR